jgi:hypothetical protein
LVRLLRSNQRNSTLCFRYNDLCSLDTIQVDVVPEKKGNQHLFLKKSVFKLKFYFSGVIIRHVEYEITSMVNILFFSFTNVTILFFCINLTASE